MEPLRLLPDMESFHRLMGDRLPRLAGSVPLSALLSSTQFSSSCSPCSGGGGAEPRIGPTAANRGRSAALGSPGGARRQVVWDLAAQLVVVEKPEVEVGGVAERRRDGAAQRVIGRREQEQAGQTAQRGGDGAAQAVCIQDQELERRQAAQRGRHRAEQPVAGQVAAAGRFCARVSPQRRCSGVWGGSGRAAHSVYSEERLPSAGVMVPVRFCFCSFLQGCFMQSSEADKACDVHSEPPRRRGAWMAAPAARAGWTRVECDAQAVNPAAQALHRGAVCAPQAV